MSTPGELKEIGRYQIEKYLGSGTFADVYCALDQQLRRRVALKVLKTSYRGDEEIYARFKIEALSAANLSHPHIAWVWDMGEDGDKFYITQRYIEGQPLDRLVRDTGHLSWAKAYQYTCEIGEALVYAHARDVIHRDVKPQNILISPVDGAVLTDFGLAKAISYSGLQTRSGGVVGTLQYIPPEIWNGEPATQAVDQYALGCVLVEMLTGHILFQASSLQAIAKKHFDRPMQGWHALPADAPSGVDRVIMKAINPRPLDRYNDISDFLAALRTLCPPPVEPTRNVHPHESAIDVPSNTTRLEPRGPQERKPTGSEPSRTTSNPSGKPSGDSHQWFSLLDRNVKPASRPGRRELVLGRDAKARVMRLTRKKMILGRQPDCDIKFADPEISRHHCQLSDEKGVMTLRDLDSANGTYLNNIRVMKEPVPLRDGDVIRLGKMTEIVYREG